MSHNIHIFKVHADTPREAASDVEQFLDDHMEACATERSEENPEGTYPGFDYYHIFGVIDTKTELLSAIKNQVDILLGDDRGQHWRMRFGTLEAIANDVLEKQLTIAQLRDVTSEYLPHEYWECGCTNLVCFQCDKQGNPYDRTTHLVMVDFHN